VNQIVGGFTLNGDVTASTGFPFTYSYNECGNDRDTGLCRPDKIASAGLGSRSFDAAAHSVVYFNPVAPLTVNGASSGAFRRPQLAQFGNVGNDSAFGPGEVNVDLALNKLFTIRERYSLQLRAEVYNALNHPNYGIRAHAWTAALARTQARSRMLRYRCGSCSSLPAFSFKHFTLSAS
jgi:hypothetical protein